MSVPFKGRLSVRRALPFIFSLNTFLLSIAAYSFFIGFEFSLLFMFMIAIHEIGHYIAFWMKKIHCSVPYFIPFLGAIILQEEKIERGEDEAFIGYGGPFLGTIGAIILYCIYLKIGASQSTNILLIVSFFALFMNLINLIPIRPLDGGLIIRAIGEWVKYLGLLILIAFIFFIKSPIFLLVLIAALGEMRMHAYLRFALGTLCQVAMIAGIFFFAINTATILTFLIASFFAFLFNRRYFYAARFGIELGGEQKSDISFRVRLMWSILYMSLAFLIFSILIHQSLFFAPILGKILQ